MKRSFILCFIMSCVGPAIAQEVVIQKARHDIDSILKIMDVEKDGNKRFSQVLAIYSTSSEGFPVLMFEIYQKMFLLAQKNKDLIAESSAWSFAGQGYRLTGNYIKALESHHKAVALAEQSGNPMLLGYAQNQMAHIYKDREETDKAISLYRSAAINIEKGDNELLAMWPSMNLGAVLSKTDQLDSSLYFSKKAYGMLVKYDLRGYTDYVLSNIATVYSKKNELPQAQLYFTMAIQQAEKSQAPRFLNTTYVAVAEHFYRHHQTDSCVYYAKKAIEIVRNTMVSNLALKPARLLTSIYEKTNADSTLKYLQVYTAANDSLFSTRANQQLQMLTFEEDQRQRNMADEKIRYQNKIKANLLLAGLALVVLIALFLYRNNRQRKKANIILQKTLADLKSAQAQLVQSEKMASLGELNAGIAHEIQNPLNFVNNFSEVSVELADEMKEELVKGNYDEARAIADDIKQNLEKINHHGKRADGIVKGMLQHSRTSSGTKEPTDINNLADEYLRLAYHGLRAKEKSFNATLKTDYDNSISNIRIIPQDIGRVLLNLITNAFYTVTEKKGKSGNEFEPTVSLSTKKAGDKIIISIADNGNGIPAEVMGKIFQPFFTTKPTGQGTGLGLSLAYDIIKAHGGELKVETQENIGSIFTIHLPLQ